MLRVIIISKGSAGDINPYTGIGQALKERGHDVHLIANDHFRLTIEKAGLNFISMGTEDEYQQGIDDPRAQHPRKSFQFLCKELFLAHVRKNLDYIHQINVHGDTAILAHATAPEGRLAREIFSIPTVLGVPQPMWLRSAVNPPKSSLNIPQGGVRWNRAMYCLVDRFLLDPPLKELNIIRAEYGFKEPVKRFFKHWWFDVDLVVGLFPKWFAPRQPDWPGNFAHTGFVLCDGVANEETPEHEWEAMLKEYDAMPPVVFTTGTPFAHEERFFQIEVDACRTLERPGILLTPYSAQVPASLPAYVRHFKFVPFSKLFPRVFCVVHHGGINTVAACLAAGVPQIIVPTKGGFDQVDNGRRVETLGVGCMLSRASLTPSKLADAILSAEAYTGDKRAHYAREMERVRSTTLPTICDLIEKQIGRYPGC